MYDKIKYLPVGDKSLVMEFGNEISPEINKRIRLTMKGISEKNIRGIEELIPTYRSILIIYNPLLIKHKDLVSALETLERSSSDEGNLLKRIVEIPTIYGNEYGSDIEFVAEHNNLTVEDVVNIHTSVDYLIYMLGFTPGFTYLGGLDSRIATPRLEVPRTKIPAGSTGIAGSQTGIYPIESPGGWQLIGRTPLELYNPYKNPPVLLKAGDYVRFVRIDRGDYDRIKDLVEKNEYEIRVVEESD